MRWQLPEVCPIWVSCAKSSKFLVAVSPMFIIIITKKSIAKQLNAGQHHQACRCLESLSKALSQIRVKFKNTVILV